jgi:hypothetical protein
MELEKVAFDLRESISDLLKPLVLRGEKKGLEVRAEIACEVPAMVWATRYGCGRSFSTSLTMR